MDDCWPAPFGCYATGSTDYTLCPVGHYADEEGLAACKPCDAGTYVDYEGAFECDVCPEGTTSGSGASVCV